MWFLILTVEQIQYAWKILFSIWYQNCHDMHFKKSKNWITGAPKFKVVATGLWCNHIKYIHVCLDDNVAQWARIKPNCAKTVFILNFAAESSGALKCSLFYLLCSPYRLNNEMLTMHRQICLKTAETSPENCKWLQSTRIYAAKFYMTES